MKLPTVTHYVSRITFHFITLLQRRLDWPKIVIIFSFMLIFTGSALAANNDRRPPTAERLSASNLYLSAFSLQPSAFSSPSPTDGAGLYQFWCSTCHGDRGQGLTPEWRAEWPEGKQNCWQSKCHATNHPPDGFSFPQNVPALIGQDVLTKFTTAQDLYIYARATMPYWSPNLLSDDEYQAITIFLVKANYTERGFSPPASLPQDLTAVPLHPEVKGKETLSQPSEASLKIERVAPQAVDSTSEPTPAPQPLPPGMVSNFIIATLTSRPLWWFLLLGGILLGFLARHFLSRSQ